MTWNLDKSHSEILFAVRHMMISKVRGQFESFDGDIHFDPNNPTASTVDIQIDAASINTRDEKRDGHLKSPDFLDVANHPYIKFKSTKIEQASANSGKLVGNLTIAGVTRPVVLDVEYAGTAVSPWGTTSAGFSAKTRIKRSEWNLTWNQALETGGFLVGDDIDISIEVELVKVPEQTAEAAA